MFFISDQYTNIQTAFITFIAAIQSGSVVLPGGLAAVGADTNAFWPSAIVYQQKVVPINYNTDTNVITLNTGE